MRHRIIKCNSKILKSRALFFQNYLCFSGGRKQEMPGTVVSETWGFIRNQSKINQKKLIAALKSSQNQWLVPSNKSLSALFCAAFCLKLLNE